MNGLFRNGVSLSPDLVERFAWVLLHTLWQFSFVALVAALALRIVSQRRSAARYSVLVGLIVLAVACPFATWQWQGDVNQGESWRSEPVTSSDRILAKELGDDDHIPAADSGDSVPKGQSFDPLDSEDWTASAEPTHIDDIRQFNWAQQIDRQLRPCCKWIVGLWLTGVLLGSFRPVLGWITLRRLARVGVAPASEEVLESLFFYHPAIWWLSRQIRAEREHCCDDVAIAATNNRAEYGRGLLTIEVARGKAKTYALAASDGPMLTRVRRIVGLPHERTDGSAWVMLLLVACLVAMSIPMAVVAQNSAAAMDDEKSVDPPVSLSEIANLETAPPTSLAHAGKHPYCIVDVDNLTPRSLTAAIDAFNLAARQSPIGARQEPITMEETLGEIARTIEQPHVSDATKQVLREIIDSKELPSNVYLRRFTRYDDDEQMHGVWWVRLVVEGDQQPVYSVPIRTKHVFSRPYTQMERLQLAQQGVTLINRFSSYFEDVPNILLLVEFPDAAVKRITDQLGSAIKTDDCDAFVRAFEWKDVSESTRTFVKSEFDLLTKSTIHSIKVTPRNFRGKLLHWSAYQYYEPNLTIVGYVDIEYSTTAGGRRKTLSLEMASVENELRLVNYVAKGPREFPKTLPQGLSIRGHTEQLTDGTFLVTSIISNPGDLTSAHLANEEIWQRDYGGKYESDIEWIARKIIAVSPAETWRLHQSDDQPSVSINGCRGFRIMLRRTWKEFTGAAQQRASVSPDPDAPVINHDVDWEFVLFPQQAGDVTADFKSRISWDDNNSPYHTRDIYLGEGHGYYWFSRSTLFDQENVRTKLGLHGGDDRIQQLVDGLTIRDAGTMTSNTCRHLVALYGDAVLPILREAIRDSRDEGDEWRIIGSLAYIRSPKATQMLLELYHSTDQNLHQAAVYALVHQPYREDAKAAYMDMLSRQERIDRLASACEAVVEFGWEDALPTLRQRIAEPRSIRELTYTVAARRALEGNPIEPSLAQATQRLSGAASTEEDPQRAAEIANARRILVASKDNEVANLMALSLMQFTTKGNADPVRQIGLGILTRRPRQSTMEFLVALNERLPQDQQGYVKLAIDALEDTGVEVAGTDRRHFTFEKSNPGTLPDYWKIVGGGTWQASQRAVSGGATAIEGGSMETGSPSVLIVDADHVAYGPLEVSVFARLPHEDENCAWRSCMAVH